MSGWCLRLVRGLMLGLELRESSLRRVRLGSQVWETGPRVDLEFEIALLVDLGMLLWELRRRLVRSMWERRLENQALRQERVVWSMVLELLSSAGQRRVEV